MEYANFVKLVNEVGEDRILVLYFDNDRSQCYPNGDFSLNDAIDYNGELVIKAHCHIHSKGPTGGKIDIPVTVYNTELQSVVVLDDTNDRKRIDVHNLYRN